MQNTSPIYRIGRAIVAAAVIIGCSSSAASDDTPGGPTTPVTPNPPAPPATIVFATDSVVASMIAGAGQVSQKIDVTAGTTTPVTGLTVADVAFGAGQPTGWVTATVSSQTPPATLLLTINASALSAGAYDAIVHVGATGVALKAVPVRLTVRARPRLSVDRNLVSFDAALGDAITPQTIAVASIGGSIDSISVGKPDCGGSATSWLAATLDSAHAPTTIRLAVSPTGLAAGSYACTLGVATSQPLVDSASQPLKVTLSLHAAPRIGVPKDTVGSIVTRAFDGGPVAVPITNLGTGTLTGLSIGKISYDSPNVDWVTASLDSATAPTTLTLRPTARSLPAGTFLATIPILSSATGVVNSPASVTLRLLVAPQPPGLAASPGQVSFTRHQGDPGVGPTATVAILRTGDGIVTHMGFPNGPPNPPFPLWIQPSLGCVGPEFDAPCTLQLWTLPNSLTPGTYSGSVTVKSFAQNLTASVGVTLTIIP